jgi:hypothetical protein
MDAAPVAIDLAKDVFELAFADAHGRILERKRLSRGTFSRCLTHRPSLRVVMEACGSAHDWARVFQAPSDLTDASVGFSTSPTSGKRTMRLAQEGHASTLPSSLDPMRKPYR